MAQALEFHGHCLEYVVRHGDTPRYVVSLTWIRTDTYRVETRYWAPLGPGYLLYEKGFESEDLARADARRCVNVCGGG